MKVIAIGLEDGVGKDTFARFLTEAIRMRQKQISALSFATKLKNCLYELYAWAGVQRAEYYDKYPSEKEKPISKLGGKTYRDLMIQFAEKVKEDDPRCFVNATIHSINKLDYLVIRDLRYRVEIDALKEAYPYDVITVRVRRREIRNRLYELDNYNWSYEVNNDGDLHALNRMALDFASLVLAGRFEDFNRPIGGK